MRKNENGTFLLSLGPILTLRYIIESFNLKRWDEKIIYLCQYTGNIFFSKNLTESSESYINGVKKHHRQYLGHMVKNIVDKSTGEIHQNDYFAFAGSTGVDIGTWSEF